MEIAIRRVILIILKISDVIFGLTYPWSTLICFRVECTTAYKYFQDIGFKDKIMLKNTKKRRSREDDTERWKQTTDHSTADWQDKTEHSHKNKQNDILTSSDDKYYIIENIDFRQKNIKHLHKRTFCCLLSQSCLTLSWICIFI